MNAVLQFFALLLICTAHLLINAEVPAECYDECGLTDKQQYRIMGGTPQSTTVLPFMAFLEDIGSHCVNGENVMFKIRCSAFIVATNKIITAAHCIVRPKRELLNCENQENEVGRLDELLATSEDRLRVHVRRGSSIAEQITHTVKSIRVKRKYYKNKATSNDIAVLTLREHIQFKEGVRPICVAEDLMPEPGTIAVVAGFGYKTNISSNGVDVVTNVDDESLHETFLSVVSPEICLNSKMKCPVLKFNGAEMSAAEMSRHVIFSKSGDNSGGVLCATRPRYGVEEGDSGGPLVVVSGGRHYAIGVTSRAHVRKPDRTTDPDKFAAIGANCEFLKANGIPCRKTSDALVPEQCKRIALQNFALALLSIMTITPKPETYEEWYNREVKQNSPLDDNGNVFGRN